MRSAFDSNAGQWQAIEAASVTDHDDGDAANRVRAVFISDIHLGTAGCQAEALMDFMKTYSSDYLYLVGDLSLIHISEPTRPY